jgi:medium-chain acyl-[acyl-carrier-protein] hydrolase
MTDAEFVEKLKHLNGTPPGVFDEPELLNLILPGLRADFVLGQRYRRTRQTQLNVPTILFAGNDDEIEPAQIHGWQDAIAEKTDVIPMPGGHFFLHTHLDNLSAALSAQLRRDTSTLAGIAA